MASHPWFILGAGNIGCLWAAQLQCISAQPPHIIIRDNQYLPAGMQSLKLIHPDHTESEHTIQTVTASQINQNIHQLVVCTKAGDVLPALESIRHLLAKQCDIVLLQNGMGSQQSVVQSFPEANIWIGSSTDGAWLKSPLEVCHAGRGNTLMGSLSGVPTDRLMQMLEYFPLDIEPRSDIETVLWQKLAVSCAINGLTALYDCQNGELLNNDKKNRLDHLVDEFIHTMQAIGQSVAGQLHEQTYNVCRVTANNYSSTCMDARLQRKTELAYINGFLLEQAHKVGLQLPTHQQLMTELSEKGVRW